MEEHKTLDQMNLQELKKQMTGRAIVKSSDMNNEMQQDVQETVMSGIESNISPVFNVEAASKAIKENLDKKYGPTWQVIIGEGFAYDVTVQNQTLLFMFYNGNLAILEELKARLTSMQYQVTQEAATERPFQGEYNDCFEKGNYHCIVCESKLFESETKYESSCGWPAFYKGLEYNIEEKEDFSHGMFRTEVLCNNCGAHLGHKFNDGPKNTTGIRYCINSASLVFKK